jgi:hypothetical protein
MFKRIRLLVLLFAGKFCSKKAPSDTTHTMMNLSPLENAITKPSSLLTLPNELPGAIANVQQVEIQAFTFHSAFIIYIYKRDQKTALHYTNWVAVPRTTAHYS